MSDRREEIAHGCPDALGGAVGGDQVRMLLLEFDQLPQELIELSVGDDRLVGDVIPVVVLSDLGAKLLDPVGRVGRHGANPEKTLVRYRVSTVPPLRSTSSARPSSNGPR